MRILIGNHIDPPIRDRGDLRAWTQRILWFAREGDLVLLCTEPDQGFLAYVTALTGVDPGRVRVLTVPPGGYGGRLLDPDALTDPRWLAEVRTAIGDAVVEELFALWPSPAVARFAAALGLSDRCPGAGFLAQSGGELANSKAVFRALAAAAGVPVAPGAVCRSPGEAVAACRRLLTDSGAVVVKQAHNGAGVGNQLLLTDPALPVGHAGARHLHHLAGPGGLDDYWRQRWDWASAGGRHPVVVEQFVANADSLYSEHHLTDTGHRPTETGRLCYVGRRLSHQIVPLRDVPEPVTARLLDGGSRLAGVYAAIGYRGHLSADAIATPDGEVLFTEVNAQVSGSLHIYQVIAHQIVDVDTVPRRTVVEYHVPPHWAVPDLTTFLHAADELGCGYDPAARTGVIVSMPADIREQGAQFVFCIAYRDDTQARQILDRLDRRFTARPGQPAEALIPCRPPVTATTVSPAAIQLTPTYDTGRLTTDLEQANSHVWNRQRTHTRTGDGPVADIDWRVLPLRSQGGDAHRTDPGGPGPADFAFTGWLDRMPYLARILTDIPAPLHAVRLMALGPGATSQPHRDPKYALHRGFVRLHIPLVTHPGAVLILDGVEHRWQPGQLWFGDFSRTHQVANTGPVTRVHAVIDALLTPELADWFPHPWPTVLRAGHVLLNHHTPATTGSAPPLPAGLPLPAGFTDFGHDEPLTGPPRTVAVAPATGRRLLLHADGRDLLLVPAGRLAHEYRFAGWSEARTLQLLPDTVVLHARDGREHHELRLPLPR